MIYVVPPGDPYLKVHHMTHLPTGIAAWTRYLESALYNAARGRHAMSHKRMKQAAVAAGVRR